MNELRTIDGKDNDVEFSSTDYELSLVEFIPAEIKEQGSICVNAKKVFDIVKELQAEMVQIKSTEQLWGDSYTATILFGSDCPVQKLNSGPSCLEIEILPVKSSPIAIRTSLSAK